MASILKVDKIRVTGNDSDSISFNNSGNITLNKTVSSGTLGSSVVFPAGHVIQTVNSTSTSTVSTSSNTAQALISASISPKFTNSVIHVDGYIGRFQLGYGSSNAYGTIVMLDPSDNTLAEGIGGSNIANSVPVAIHAVHSPNSTSSQTYELRLAAASGGTGTVSTDGQRYSLRLTEIAQ